MKNTSLEYDKVTENCKNIFLTKMKDYGSSWRILRTSSLTDQIFIKAQRIRSIEEKKEQKIEDDINAEYIGILNYAVIALIQTELKDNNEIDLDVKKAEVLYDKHIEFAKKLMEDKNHDYGEAWREMRISSITDIILMRLLRIKQIEDNLGKTLVSEGIDSNFYDIINYAAFSLIKLSY